MRIISCLACIVLLSVPAPTTTAAQLGSLDFRPTPDDSVGWRGDGSGRYPGASPPTAWQRIHSGSGYSAKGIVWMARLPGQGVSCPIVVGERIYLTTEVSDLVCLDKRSGKILWIRSNPEFEALSDAERKENPAFAEKLDPVGKELGRTNDALVEALNRELPSAAAAAYSAVPELKRKLDLEKQIADGQKSIDRKKFDRYWGQAVFGFSGPTPVGDGKHIFAFFTTGVCACYDLDGHRAWMSLGSGHGSEHGNFASPLLCGNRLVVWANGMRGYDVETGKLLWSNRGEGGNTYGSFFRLKAGNDWVAGFQSGYFARISDGKAIWGDMIFGDGVMTPIVEGSTLLAATGYPHNAGKAGFASFKIASGSDGPPPALLHNFKTDWKDDEIPEIKGKGDFARSYVSSPLLVGGLVYRLSQGGGLLVNDVDTGEIIYRKVTRLAPRTIYWNWAGCSASPTLAGKYIYLMDNMGHTLIIEAGKTYKEISRNFLQDTGNGEDQVQNVSSPIFEGSRMYYRTPNYLYCIGDR